MNNQDKIKELRIDEWIWVVFIVLSILNIIGDECEKACYINYDANKDKLAKKIFTFTVFISFLIYCYLAYQRYSQVKLKRKYNQDTNLDEFRLFGSILVVIAAIIFLYYQLETTTAENPSIE